MAAQWKSWFGDRCDSDHPSPPSFQDFSCAYLTPDPLSTPPAWPLQSCCSRSHWTPGVGFRGLISQDAQWLINLSHKRTSGRGSVPGTELRDGAAGNSVPRLLPGKLAAGAGGRACCPFKPEVCPCEARAASLAFTSARRIRQRYPHLTEAETQVCGPKKGGPMCRK